MKSAPAIATRFTRDDLALIGFWVPGIPKPQGSMRGFSAVGSTRVSMTSDNKGTADWRGDVKTFAFREMAGKAMLVGVPVFVHAYFVLKRPASTPKRAPTPPAIKKPDCDKLLRAIFDAMTGIVYADDSQVTEEFADKRLAEEFEQPGCWVSVGRRVEYL